MKQGERRMTTLDSTLGRRRFLQAGAALGAVGFVGFLAPEAFAEQLMGTPPLTEGPFYPDKLPLDTDNDLIIVNGNITPAVGEITHLTGRVLDAGGGPVKNVTVEIWQCDAHQVYLNTRDSESKASQRDPNFQGFGCFTTGSKGEYRFRTIKPVAYPGRPAPHIHFKVKRGDRELLTTQLMIRGYPGNARDGVFRGVRDLVDRELIVTDFKPIKESKIGELSANFDIVLGRTPDENEFGR
jgi:protocatechuate 3,4-dioxygenase beta subunit